MPNLMAQRHTRETGHLHLGDMCMYLKFWIYACEIRKHEKLIIRRREYMGFLMRRDMVGGWRSWDITCMVESLTLEECIMGCLSAYQNVMVQQPNFLVAWRCIKKTCEPIIMFSQDQSVCMRFGKTWIGWAVREFKETWMHANSLQKREWWGDYINP